jgi:SAM-dependent methyltransferase
LTRKKWGEQWDTQSMNCLLDSGPNPLFRNALSAVTHQKCLVIGAGGEVSLVGGFCNNIVAINIARDSLQKIRKFNADLIIADAQRLPLKDSCVDMVVCKSTLHHLSDLNYSIREIKRVASVGSDIFLYEPNVLNFIAFIGRKLFPTDIHDPTEKPFNPFKLRKVIQKNFKVLNETDFFILVHAIPVLQKKLRIPANLRILSALSILDAFLCKTFFKNFSWIIVFTLRKI